MLQLISALKAGIVLFLLIFTCFFVPLTAQTQALIDSLENVLQTTQNDTIKMSAHDMLRRKYVRIDLEKATFHAEQVIKLAKQLNNIDKYNVGKISLGQVLFYKGKDQLAIQYFLEAEPFFSERRDSSKLGSIYNGLAVCYQESNDSITLVYFKKAYDLLVNVNDKKAALALINMSNVYADSDRYKKAIPLLREGIALLDPVEHRYYYNMGQINLANSLSETGKNKEAEKINREIIQAYEDQKNIDLYAFAKGGLGFALYQQGKYKEAIKHFEEGIELGEKIGFREDLLHKLLDLTNAYEKTKNYQGAFQTLAKYQVLADSFFTEDKEQILTDAIQKFEGEKKDQQIALLNVENELTTLKFQRSNRSRLFFIALSLGLLIFAGLLYRLIRVRRKANQKLQTKNKQIKKALNDKEMLLKEIHHRVKNNLQVISSLLSIQSRQIDDPLAQEAMQESRNRVRSMALIHQNLYQDEQLVGVSTKEYIEKLADSLVHNYSLRPNQIKMETDIDDVKLDVETIIPLGLILNELISNALKYAFENEKTGKIIVRLKRTGESLDLIVSDNGIGIPKSFSIEESDSLGFRLIQAFSTKLGAELKIGSEGQGTSIQMHIPNFKAA